jgi:hypothetical protein
MTRYGGVGVSGAVEDDCVLEHLNKLPLGKNLHVRRGVEMTYQQLYSVIGTLSLLMTLTWAAVLFQLLSLRKKLRTMTSDIETLQKMYRQQWLMKVTSDRVFVEQLP